MSKTSAAVKNRYNAKHYDRISVVVPKGEKDAIALQAQKRGYSSVSEYIRDLLAADAARALPAPSEQSPTNPNP